MRVINNPKYTFTALDNGYKLTSLAIIPILVTVEKIDKYEVSIQEFQKTLEVGETYEFSLITDGRYILTVATEPKVYFTHFANIRGYLLNEIASLICNDCGCDCTDSSINCLEKKLRKANKNLALSNIIQDYIRINKDFSLIRNNDASPLVREFLDIVYNDFYYGEQHEIAKQLLSSSLSGQFTVNPLLFQFHIAMYYIAIYFEAKSETSTIEQEKAVDALYKYVEILPCLLKLGLNPADMQTEFNKTEANLYYWQTAPTDTIQIVASTLSDTLLLSKPSVSLPIMYEGSIIPLTTVGKLVFAISKIPNSNFLIQDSLGTDVTNDFDYVYDSATQTALFVSQLVYSHSNIYFRFKRLV